MYKLFIVDDEEVEREGMAKLIPWKDYGVELIGTAWNGVEGFEKIQNTMPDIVLTDIKMPLMDGIELIRKTSQVLPDIVFIVLSGYGEFEYTSRAMKEGVRHYILKPCDEENILQVLEKVKQEIDQRRESQKQREEIRREVGRLLPRAKEQLFRNILLGLECTGTHYRDFLKEIEDQNEEVCVFAIRGKKPFDSLEQFIIGNIYGELTGEEKVLTTATVANDLFLLARPVELEKLEEVLQKLKAQFLKIKRSVIQAAVSRTGTLEEGHKLYLQVQELFVFGELEHREGLLYTEMLRETQGEASVFQYLKIHGADSYEEILYECCAAFMKMDNRGWKEEKKKRICFLFLKMMYGEKVKEEVERLKRSEYTGIKLQQAMADILAEKENVKSVGNEEQQRMEGILSEIYRNIGNPELNIQYLTRKILFMNEDYFGRLFQKQQQEKFSAYLLRKRIMLAKELINDNPEIRISKLAETVGYAPDAQYFSKVFRKMEGVTPSEYKENIKRADK